MGRATKDNESGAKRDAAPWPAPIRPPRVDSVSSAMSSLRSLSLLAACVVVAAACAHKGAPPDTLVVAADRDVEGIDPHTSGQVLQTQTVLANVYEGLITFDAQMSLVPALALSWSNPDELTWDFQIRTGVPFQTGGVL